MKYDFFIAGRWRNEGIVREVLETVRASGNTAYCFIENDYKGEKVEFITGKDADKFMQESEVLAQDDKLIKKIFETDMNAELHSQNFLLVFPAGISSHIEAGVAYGAGKKCYAVGIPEKTEPLYTVFETIFPDVQSLKAWLNNSNNTL
jgi:hypothetical protein